MGRCETPSAPARCFSSARKRSKLAPLWQDAARGEAAIAGRGEAAGGLVGAAKGCWADAADQHASAAMIAIQIRIPGNGISIHSPASRDTGPPSTIPDPFKI